MSALDPFTFLEFFAGGGLARAGLGADWNCLFANDIDEKKGKAYAANWGSQDLHIGDVNAVAPTDLPAGVADLAHASFPCQDLSLAGVQSGLGSDDDASQTRSGAFWPFWRLMEKLRALDRAPRIITLENVYGALRSKEGSDFITIVEAFTAAGYKIGAMIIDARLFVPQSRPRLFFVATRGPVPFDLAEDAPSKLWHGDVMPALVEKMSPHAQKNWIWWSLPKPPTRKENLIDILEDEPESVKWNSDAKTQKILAMMSPTNIQKIEDARKTGQKMVGGVYRRTRIENDRKVQRTEIRFDNVAGCLRTPSGGSSRQTLIMVEGAHIRSRLISTRETARLMGLPDSYVLPKTYNDAYHLTGDGVAVPAVRHLAKHILEPLLSCARPTS